MTTLKDLFRDKVVMVGIGNILRADDGFGPILIKRLKGKVKSVCIDAGTAPENYAGKIIKEKPGAILLIDAVDLGLEAGRYKILEKSDILKSGFTTHDLSPRLFMEYLEKKTRVRIYMLGVQPKNLSLGDKMSDSLKQALENLEKAIKEINGA